MPERDFLHGYGLVYGLLGLEDDPKRQRPRLIETLDEAFPSHPALPERIVLRLNALAEMWQHPMMDAWRGAQSNRALSDTALRVAATHPLCRDGWFNAESFFAEMLRRIDEEGCA